MMALKFYFYAFVFILYTLVRFQKEQNDKVLSRVDPTINNIDAIKIYPLILNLFWQIHFALCL